MVLKHTRHNLKKLETLFGELDYKVRYEKGHFKAGYAIVENNKVIVINKFYDLESRINCLIDILGEVGVDTAALSEPSAKLYRQLSSALSEEEE